jgi:hypothetical protein
VKYSSAEPLGKSLAGWAARERFEVVECAKERKTPAGTRVLAPGANPAAGAAGFGGVPQEADSEGVGRREEVRVGSGVLKVLRAFWDKLEGSCRRPQTAPPRI